MEVAVASSLELQVELVNLMSQCLDDEGAVKWARHFRIPEEMVPECLIPLMKSEFRNQQ